MGVREPGAYAIDLDGSEGPKPVVHVNCSFTGDLRQYVIQHDHGNVRHSKGHGDFELVEDMIYYDKTYDQVRAIVESAENCSYTFNFMCRYVRMSDNGWLNYFGVQKHFMETEGTVKGKNCEYSTFTNKSRTVTETENFPIRTLLIGDTNNSGEELYYQVEPLICDRVTSTWNERFKEDNGKYYKDNTRLSNPHNVVNNSCSLAECALQCVAIGCAVFSSHFSFCICELSYACDNTSSLYHEEAAPGFVMYKTC